MRFLGRNVYTVVVPIENFAPYSGDWIVWFAERQARAGDAAPFVRAPIPLRKFESVEPVLPGARSELRVQFAAIVTKEGKLDSISILKSVNPAIDQAVLQDLAAWEFKPATRDAFPVDVDVVIEIPYSLPPQIARGGQP
jgi:TonB family protein